ncbi:hypothetical protein O9993_01220 [Vibrio lentus]|nr:hypothetical protein [Vibrio lentus]
MMRVRLQIFCFNNLHIEIQIDPSAPIGSVDVAVIKDVLVEDQRALHCFPVTEDSVAAVDGETKHWLTVTSWKR